MGKIHNSDRTKVEPYDRYRIHMPRSSNITMVVLKGHLLVEEQLNGFIEAHLRRPQLIDKARLSFSQKVALARALEELDWALDAADALNRIRNELAHRLDSQRVAQLVEAFLAICGRGGEAEDVNNEPIARRLKNSVAMLCGVFSGMADVVEHMQRKT